MEHISITEAIRHFSELLNRVLYQGMSFELKQGHKIVARLSPVNTSSTLQVNDLNHFFAQLPPLEDDLESFAKDVQAIRQNRFQEKIAWD